MRFKLFPAIAALGLVWGSAASAAQDPGLHLGGSRDGSIGQGFAARAGVTVKLGSPRSVRPMEKVTLAISAGPVLAIADGRAAGGIRHATASFASVTVKPGYSTSLAVAGWPALSSFTALGAAEDEKDGDRGKSGKKQSTGSKIAWVAAVAGGVMIALIGAVVIHCDNGNCSE